MALIEDERLAARTILIDSTTVESESNRAKNQVKDDELFRFRWLRSLQQDLGLSARDLQSKGEVARAFDINKICQKSRNVLKCDSYLQTCFKYLMIIVVKS